MQIRHFLAASTLLMLTACMDVNITQEIAEEPDTRELALASDPHEFQDLQDVYEIVSQQPTPADGLAALAQEIRYPEIARKAGVEGSVVVSFVVDETGHVLNAQVERGIGAGCDEEALRVIRKTKFKPGVQDGQPVKVRTTLPIRFKLKGMDSAAETNTTTFTAEDQ